MRSRSNYSTSHVNYNAAHVPAPYNSVMSRGFKTIPLSLTTFASSQIDEKCGF